MENPLETSNVTHTLPAFVVKDLDSYLPGFNGHGGHGVRSSFPLREAWGRLARQRPWLLVGTRSGFGTCIRRASRSDRSGNRTEHRC